MSRASEAVDGTGLCGAGKVLAALPIAPMNDWTVVETVIEATGMAALYFHYVGDGLLDLKQFELTL
ncbi:MAG: hypothetical protein LUF30_01270 [Lachnospiraceae bacterium]|nr:hypothetical protein [Lachnospiraceae bacterium]